MPAIKRTLRLQARPLHFLDTHAGRGIYDLSSAEAQKTGEAALGIAALMAQRKRPAILLPYFNLIQKFNTPARLRTYPGSPAIAATRLRPSDRLTLCEMHPREITALREHFAQDVRIDIKNEDGWDVLQRALRARSERRLIVLVDPSYETSSDYDAAIAAANGVKHAPRQSVMLLWFPILSDGRHDALMQAAIAVGGHVAIVNWPPPETGRVGLLGSAIAIFDADHRLRTSIYRALEAVAPLIGGILSISDPQTNN
jgi:23S rRNA (adenine2030-N6)-methyltransferase